MGMGTNPFRYNNTQVVAYTGTAGTSSAVGSQTYAVKLVATTNCHVKVTQAGTAATTSDTYIAGNAPAEYVCVSPGDKISVVEDSAGGNLYITELTY